jgi:membrane protein implicated in regulation of membrane protease activity
MGLTPFIWALLGILLTAGEVLAPGFVIFFFGIGALLNAALTALVPFIRSNIPLQILLWLASSVASLGALRKYFAKAFKGKLISGLDDTEVIGMQAVVVEEISPDRPGRIRFQGTTWTAQSFDERLPVGKTVEILRKEGLTFTVTSSILGDKELTT